MLLSKQCQNEYKTKLNQKIKDIKKIKSFDDVMESWYFKQLLTNTDLKKVTENKITLKELKNKMILNVTKQTEKALQKDLRQIKNTLNYPFIKWGKIETEWIKSNTWGNCPRGYYRNGHEYVETKSIGGCGYDKLSTLTAKLLNNDIYFKAFLFNYCQKHAINKNNIEKKLHYGIGMHNGMPYMKGGVGVSCHVAILKKMGFKVDYIELKKSDFISFELKNKKAGV